MKYVQIAQAADVPINLHTTSTTAAGLSVVTNCILKECIFNSNERIILF
jgi:hypothetical protein